MKPYKLQSLLIIIVFFQPLSTVKVKAQDIAYAKDLYAHNLKSRALELFIEIFHNSKTVPDTKAEALYYMGQISFDDGRYSVALDDWQQLIENYPTNQKAVEIKDRLSQLREVFAKASDASISSAIAQSYISNGDFWSKAEMEFTIDSSWLPKVELAIQWYDKTIMEYSGLDAAEIAFQHKLFTILGWEKSSDYGSDYGIKGNFTKYMPLLLKTFSEFETAFQKSSYLQGFRYQIAQAYWRNKDWPNTKLWLNKVIESGKGQSSFYTETAKARLNKVEY